MKILKWMLARLKERNTWIGFTTLLTTAGVGLNPELRESIIAAGIAIAGLILTITKDDPKADE